ncbi:MAG TPA: prolyl oligopeptidase family serine peptidase [Ktedonobacteraceae bacterium]|nr:prolyl oligopeptidase family serine peptidase [Ktedonobacteraceae bacterium]
MNRRPLILFALFALFCGLLVSFVGSGSASASAYSKVPTNCVLSSGTNLITGTASDGANYKIEVPSNWNGTLVLYSHGYVFVGSPLVAEDAGDPLTGATLLAQGYALAGSSYSQNGWALQQAFHDQIALLDYFDSHCGHPLRTIAWGHSLGGIITAGLIQLFPDRFNAALPMCGVLAGGIGTWNQALDGAFAFDVLLAGNTLPIVRFNPATLSTDFSTAEADLAAAQSTAQGRARIALFSSLGDVPGWFDPASPEPAKTDYTSQEVNQFLWESKVDFLFAFFARAELESRAGGNPSWNTGVNYSEQLEKSATSKEVKALYKQAGLSLNKDLESLNEAPRISADPGAVSYLDKYISFNGELSMPVLTMHTTGDGLVVNQDEQSYAHIVSRAGDSGLLRQVFVHRAGHCTFTPAETLTAFQTLIHRLNTGKWDDTTDPGLMNSEAAALGPGFNFYPLPTNPTPPAFIKFEPTVFLRPHYAHNEA